MALCLRKSKQGLGEETDEDSEREKNNENKQADCRGFTLSFLNRLLWISSHVFCFFLWVFLCSCPCKEDELHKSAAQQQL